MKTLALDASSKSTGWAIFDGQKLEKYGCITATSSDLYKRIEKMGTELTTILNENKIDKVIIEDVVPDDVRNNGTVFRALMHLQGHLCMVLDKAGLKAEFIIAAHWRKLCGIKTGAGIKRESLKPKDIEFVKNQFGLNVNDDIADAICIGFAAVGGTIKIPTSVVLDDGFEFG